MPDDKADEVVQMSDAELLDKAKTLWRQYLSLTKDLLKFIDKEDIETFMMVVQHREYLIKDIEALPSKEYRKLPEFKEIAAQITPMDREIIYKARGWLTKSRRQNSVVRAYDLETSLILTQSLNFNEKY